MRFSHALNDLSIDVTEIDRSNAFATFSIIGMFDPFYSGESIFSQFDRKEQEDVIKRIIIQTKELGKDFAFFRIKRVCDNITIAASNTRDFDSMDLEDCLCELFFLFHDALIS